MMTINKALKCFKMFSFSVMQSSFGISDIKIIAVPTSSSINLNNLATAKSIFVRKERFNATSALKNHSKANAPVEFINTRHNLFTSDFAL